MTDAQVWFLVAIAWWLSCSAVGFWLKLDGDGMDRLFGAFVGHSFAAVTILLVYGFVMAGRS